MLPVEDGVKVLATVKERAGSYVETLYYITKDSDDLAYHLYWEGAGFYQMCDCTFHKKDNVVAWRILPKPFVEVHEGFLEEMMDIALEPIKPFNNKLGTK